jgi:tRNA(fMet)-specific endonuclease VapC
MGLILDTNIIITAEREARKKLEGKADRFFALHASDQFFITFTVAGELACGQSAAAQGDWRQLTQPFHIIPWTKAVSWTYGQLYRFLAARGELIGTNDLWIAATAIVSSHNIVTANTDEFSRIPNLGVIPF